MIWDYRSVLVNDDYAGANRTYILNTSDDPNPALRIDTHGGWGEPGEPIYVIKIGKVKCAKHLDGLFKGGPEIRFIRAEAYIDPFNNAAPRFTEVGLNKNIKRGDVKHKRWIEQNLLWDLNWVKERTEQAIIGYEFDNTKEFTFTISAKINPKITVGGVEGQAGELGGTWQKKVTMKDKERRLFAVTQQLRRETFSRVNTLDIGDGLLDGFTVWSGDNVYFNMPVQIIQ